MAYEHNTKVELNEVSTLNTVESTTKVLVLDPSTAEVKHLPLSTIYSNIVIPIGSASNGLSLVGTDVRLGGALTGNTIITALTHSFAIIGGDTDNFISLDGSTGDINIKANTTTLEGGVNITSTTPSVEVSNTTTANDYTITFPQKSGTFALLDDIMGSSFPAVSFTPTIQNYNGGDYYLDNTNGFLSTGFYHEIGDLVIASFSFNGSLNGSTGVFAVNLPLPILDIIMGQVIRLTNSNLKDSEIALLSVNVTSDSVVLGFKDSFSNVSDVSLNSSSMDISLIYTKNNT